MISDQNMYYIPISVSYLIFYRSDLIDEKNLSRQQSMLKVETFLDGNKKIILKVFYIADIVIVMKHVFERFKKNS